MNIKTHWLAWIVLAVVLTASDALAFYNTSLGRWVNRDPIGEDGGDNLYVALNNNPINTIDNFGHAPMGWPVVPPPGYPPSIPRNPTPTPPTLPIPDSLADCYADCIEKYRNPIMGQYPKNCKIVPPFGLSNRLTQLFLRAGVVVVIIDGFFDIGLLGGCAVDCLDEMLNE